MQKAAEKYIIPFPFADYNEMTNPIIVNGNLHYLHSTENDGLQIFDSPITITETTIRIYKRKVDQINSPEEPLIQIPISAIADVVDSINTDYLDLDLDDGAVQQFLESAIALRLKKDFCYVFLDNYTSNGLEDKDLEIAKKGELQTD